MLLKNISGEARTIDIAPNKKVTVPINGIFSCDEVQAQTLLDNEGDYKIVADLEAELKSNGSIPITVTTSLTSAQVLTLNTVPVNLIAAPGANLAIAVNKAIVSMDYNSAAYATNTDLELRYDNSTAGDAGGAEVVMASFDAILLATADRVAVCDGLGSADETNLTINKGITAKVATGNPATGNSPIKIKLVYTIESL